MPAICAPGTRTRRSSVVRWLLLIALLAPVAVGVTGVGDRQAGATSGSPAAVAVRFALNQLGKPYRWGADGPRSYDCSGLVQTAYRAAGVALPRVSRQQYHAGRHVRLTALRPGDLLFYADNPRDPRTIGHVGMYLGAGHMVEAPRPGRTVRIAAIWRPGLLGRATRPAAGLRGLLPVRFGERSNAVAAVQRRLTANGICLAVDGDFGPITRRAVLAFQRAHGLVADGVVGPRTWGALVLHGRKRSQPRC
jgi:peptidoglycan hydrolase-like protein with peptidoglycan-binding domain